MIYKFVLILILMFSSCEAPKIGNQNSKNIEDFSKKGFILVQTITTKNTDACATLFQTEDGELLEFSNYNAVVKELQSAYWIKFNRQRRLAKCKKAQPVEVIEIVAAESN